MPEHNVPRVFQGSRELRVHVGLLLQLLNLFFEFGRTLSQFLVQPRQHRQRLVARRSRKRHVEANHARAPGVQLLHQRCISAARQRIRADGLEGLLVNADDDDARVDRALAAHGEAKIKRALFDVLQEDETGALVCADPGISKEDKADGSRRKSDGGVSMTH